MSNEDQRMKKFEMMIKRFKQAMLPYIKGREFSGERLAYDHDSLPLKEFYLPVKLSDGNVYDVKCKIYPSTSCRSITLFLFYAEVGNIVPEEGPQGGARLGIEGSSIVPELHIYRIA